MKDTNTQYTAVIDSCRVIFEDKMQTYGLSWHGVRRTTLTDCLLIAVSRIQAIQHKGKQKVTDTVDDDFRAIVNYGLIALMHPKLSKMNKCDIPHELVSRRYVYWSDRCKSLMLAKNSDYGDIWRKLRIESITDFILQNIERIKSIEDKGGDAGNSEGLDAKYTDIVNYAVFALILLTQTDK